LEWAVVEGVKQIPDRIVELVQRQEAAISQTSENLTLYYQHVILDDSFVPGLLDPGGDYGHSVVRSHFLIRVVYRGLVITRGSNTAF
jgi:hypothetical protein